MDYADIKKGAVFQQKFTVSEEIVKTFAEITGDTNPVHLDEAFAKTTQFGKRIAHGMLVASFISKVLGRDFPGDGTIYVSQKVRFRRPVFIGDTITVEIEVMEKNDEKKRIIMRTDVMSDSGEKVVIGEAEVMKP
jgi:3-hydroxybutyryl-CoA dehydratase